MNDQSVVSKLLPRLVPGTRLVQQHDGYLTCEFPSGEILRLDAKFASAAEALLAIVRGRTEFGTLISAVSAGESGATDHFHHCLQELKQTGSCEFVWEVAGREYAVVSSICGAFEFKARPLVPEAGVILSRFAYARRDGSMVVLPNSGSALPDLSSRIRKRGNGWDCLADRPRSLRSWRRRLSRLLNSPICCGVLVFSRASRSLTPRLAPTGNSMICCFIGAAARAKSADPRVEEILTNVGRSPAGRQ